MATSDQSYIAVRTSTWAPKADAPEPSASQRIVATASGAQLIALNNEIERLERELAEANTRLQERPPVKEANLDPYNRRIGYLEKALAEEQKQHSDDLERLEKELLHNNEEWKGARERDGDRFVEMEKKVDELQDLIDDLQNQRDKHLKGQKVAEAQVHSLKEQLASHGIMADHTDTSHMLRELNTLIRSQRRSEDSTQQDIENYQDTISNQRDNWDQKHADETKKMQIRIDELQAEREQENVQFKAEFSALNKRLAEIHAEREKDRDDFQNEYNGLDERYATSRLELQDAKSNWDKAMSDGQVSADELAALRLEYESMRETLREIEMAKAIAEEEVTSHRSNWDKAVADGQLTMAELESLRKEYESMREQLAEIAAAREAAAEEAASNKSNWDRALSDGEITQGELVQLRKEYEDMRAQLLEVHNRHEAAIGEVNVVKSNWDRFAVDGQVTKQQLQQLSQEYENMYRQLQEVIAIRDHTAAQARDFKTHLDNMTAENTEFKRELAQRNAENEAGRRKLEEYDIHAQQAQRSYVDLKSNFERISTENQLARQEMNQVRVEYENVRQRSAQESASISSTTHQLRAENDALRRQLTEASARFHQQHSTPQRQVLVQQVPVPQQVPVAVQQQPVVNTDYMILQLRQELGEKNREIHALMAASKQREVRPTLPPVQNYNPNTAAVIISPRR